MSDDEQKPDEKMTPEAEAEAAPKDDAETPAADDAAAEDDNVIFENLDEDPESEDFDLATAHEKDLSAIYDIPVQISAVLGRSSMQVSQLLKLGRGAVVDLDRRVGEPIDVYVNNRLVARGEVVIVGEKLGITMTEIIKSEQ